MPISAVADSGPASPGSRTVIDSIREYDPELAQKILDEMFVFENLLDLDDRGIPATWPWPFEDFRAAMAAPDLAAYDLR